MNLDTMSRAELEELARLMEEDKRRRAQSGVDRYYPETGPLRRDLYKKHMEFFRAGATFRERLAMCANRVGKTEGMGGYETALHLTGLYPDWWEGRRFDEPIKAWAAGKLQETTRDIVQTKLFGELIKVGTSNSVDGTGLIPGRLIEYESLRFRQNSGGLLDSARIKHVSGGYSTINIKAFQQGRASFEGKEIDVVWLDEEPPLEIYGECLIRTATTNGIVMMTFTPLDGMTETVLQFLPGGKIDNAESYGH